MVCAVSAHSAKSCFSFFNKMLLEISEIIEKRIFELLWKAQMGLVMSSGVTGLDLSLTTVLNIRALFHNNTYCRL